MEDNNDMPSAFALETQPIGETGGEISAIFRDSSNITQGGVPKSEVQNASLKTIRMKYSKAMNLDLHLTDYTRINMVYFYPHLCL